MASYRVQVWTTSTTDFSPDVLLAEFENPKNLGYASYINDIGEAFFTINQHDPKANIRSQEGKGHVFIIRDEGANSDVVWRGILAEHDANARDVIFYAYGYEHLLYSLYTKWNHKFRNKKIAGSSNRPIDELWARAKALPKSPVQWITSGTFQAPYNVTGGPLEVTLNRYRANWKRIITCMRELTAIALSDTANIVFMEIDYPKLETSKGATFNFWKDNSEDNTKLRLTWGANVMDFNDRFTPVMLRNQTLGVGTGPKNQLYKFTFKVKGGTYGRTNHGLRMQNMYLSWVRDRKELKRVVKRRTRLALRENTNVYVRCFPDTVPPWRSTNSSWELGDRIYTDIQHGVTSINKWLHLVGEQVVFVNGREYTQPMLEERTGSQSSYNGMTWIGQTSSSAWTVSNTAAATVTKSVTIPANTRLVAFCFVQQKWHGTLINEAPTLDGVAGVIGLRGGVDSGSFKRYAGIYYWDDPPAGQTVNLVMKHDILSSIQVIAWGLATSELNISRTAVLDTDTVNSVSNGAEVTINAASVVGFGLVVTHHLGTEGAFTAVSGSTKIFDQTLSAGGTSSYMDVYFEATPVTGSRIAGGDGNANHLSMGVMFSNDEA